MPSLSHPIEDQDPVHFQIEEGQLLDNQWSFQPKQKQSKLPMSSRPIARDTWLMQIDQPLKDFINLMKLEVLLKIVHSQCENFMNFLSLRFYVKLILENLEVLKLLFWPFLMA